MSSRSEAESRSRPPPSPTTAKNGSDSDLAVQHGGNRDHHAREPAADVAAGDAREQAAFEAEIERGVVAV